MLRRLAIVVALSSSSACNLTLVRLERRGDHDEVLERAARRDRPPRRGGARALASALVATGDAERARDVLLGDFRRGGQLTSLVALADLERALGRDGVAAVHYTRAIALDRTVLRGRGDVCTLLRARARGWTDLDEPGSALDDLDRANALCGGDDVALRQSASARLAARLRAGAAATKPCDDCGPETEVQLQARVAEARAAGFAALRAFAERERIELAAEDVLALLLADLRGQAGTALVDDDELRRWLGEAPPEAFTPLLRAQPAPEGAYLRLRLERAFGRAPDGPVASPSQRALWMDRASVVEGAVRWRLLAYVDELTAAEQDLVARWRPRAAPEPDEGPRDGDIVRPSRVHWSLRVTPSPENLGDLATFARLRDAADDTDLALVLRRALFREAERLRVPGAGAALRLEIEHALAWGRPWIALALADVSSQADIAAHRGAAATAVLMGEALCSGPCEEDRRDLEAVERTLGAAWIAETHAALRELAARRAQVRPRAGACAGLDEVLAAGVDAPLRHALARSREPDAPGVDRLLVAAIESDPVMACAARFAWPLLAARQAAVSSARLADQLAHGPELDAAPVLSLHAALALLAQQRGRAEQLGIAAAAAGEPRTQWRALARAARVTGNRDLELGALRELLLHTPRLEDDTVRRELVAHAVLDGARGWGARDTPAGRESVVRIVDEHLARLAPARRWHEREAIIDALAAHGFDAALGEVVRTALLPGPLAQAHAHALARMGGAPVPTSTWSPASTALAVAARRVPQPPPTMVVFADPRQFEAARLAWAQGARDWAVRRRAAIGLASIGSEAARAHAVVELLAMSDARGRRALEDLLLERPAALTAAAGAAEASAVITDDVVLLHAIFGLPLSGALWLDAPAQVLP